MKLILPKISIGKPKLAEDLPVFPLHLDAACEAPLDYILVPDAKKTGALSVEKVTEGQWRLHNHGDKHVLVLWREPLTYTCSPRRSLLIAPEAVVTIHSSLLVPYCHLVRQSPYRKGAVGAVVVDEYFLLSLFDRESTCRKAWRKLLYTHNRWRERRIRHSVNDVERLWAEVCDAKWEPTDTIGAGKAWQTSGEEINGWALTLDDTLVHLQVYAPCWAEEKKKEKKQELGRIPTPPGLRRGKIEADKRQLWLPFTDE
jgi:hypothetical protein